MLKVNGRNTLEKERFRDMLCHKWVLDPDDPPITVRGYQSLANDTCESFRVLSRAESRAEEMDYGEDVGLISLVVFRERQGAVQPPAHAADDDAAARPL